LENKGAKGQGWRSFREVPVAGEAMAEGQATQGKATEQEPQAKTQEEAEAAMLQAPPCQQKEVEVQGQTVQERAIVTTVAKKGIGQESARI
jgi:hypothetical protein